MKKSLILFVVMAIIACDTGNGNTTEINTTLKIQNESFSDITDVIWSNVTFGSIKQGEYVTKIVQAGQRYVRFKRTINPITVQTCDLIIVGNGEKIELIITNSTHVVNEQNISEIGQLGSLKVLPQITIKQNNSIIEKYGIKE